MEAREPQHWEIPIAAYMEGTMIISSQRFENPKDPTDVGPVALQVEFEATGP